MVGFALPRLPRVRIAFDRKDRLVCGGDKRRMHHARPVARLGLDTEREQPAGLSIDPTEQPLSSMRPASPVRCQIAPSRAILPPMGCLRGVLRPVCPLAISPVAKIAAMIVDSKKLVANRWGRARRTPFAGASDIFLSYFNVLGIPPLPYPRQRRLLC